LLSISIHVVPTKITRRPKTYLGCRKRSLSYDSLESPFTKGTVGKNQSRMERMATGLTNTNSVAEVGSWDAISAESSEEFFGSEEDSKRSHGSSTKSTAALAQKKHRSTDRINFEDEKEWPILRYSVCAPSSQNDESYNTRADDDYNSSQSMIDWCAIDHQISKADSIRSKWEFVSDGSGVKSYTSFDDISSFHSTRTLNYKDAAKSGPHDNAKALHGAVLTNCTYPNSNNSKAKGIETSSDRLNKPGLTGSIKESLSQDFDTYHLDNGKPFMEKQRAKYGSTGRKKISMWSYRPNVILYVLCW